MKRILVIEDDARIRTGLATALRRQGYEVLEAGQGTAGLEVAFAEQPDLVLSDINMPGQGGLDVLRELRGRTETATIPVILMTGEPHKADARSSMNLGADDYLSKPFSLEQMLATVSARLERQAGIARALDARNEVERISTAEKLRLQTTALEAAANGILITDRKGRILWVNQAFTRLTGHAADEVAGQNPRILNSGRHPRQFYAELWATVTAGNVWHGELINKRKDGSLYDEEMTITPVRGEDGEIQNFIAIKQDISERKRFEQTLADKRDLLHALMDNLPDYIYFKDLNSRFTRINHALARHLGLENPEAAIGKGDADFFPVRQARQKLVDERRMLVTGEPILGLVEQSDTAAGKIWVSTTKVPTHGADGQIVGLVGVSRDITANKQAEDELQRKRAFLEAQLNTSIDGILVVDEQGRKVLQNRQLASLFAIPASIVEDPDDEKLLKWVTGMTQNPEQFLEKVRHLYAHPDQISRDEIKLKTGTILDRYSAPVSGKNGAYYGRMWTFRDITERKRMEMELFQARKLESIGHLSAGIAHEINTPTQYVGDNTRFVRDSFDAVAKILDSHVALLAAAKAGAVTQELVARAEEILAAGDLDYLRGQIPQALTETLEGVERVSKIVRAMKDFAHPGGTVKTPADINKAIESTVTVARNEWKYVADLKLDLAADLPFVPCFLSEFNQVVLNLIINAAHAIGDVVKKNPDVKGLITVQTRREGDQAEIRITDTGTGIPETARPKIFEPFFTTKDVGEGTGQGLTLVYGSVVQRHGGTVTFETELGRGTTFIVRLPLKSKAEAEAGVRPSREVLAG